MIDDIINSLSSTDAIDPTAIAQIVDRARPMAARTHAYKQLLDHIEVPSTRAALAAAFAQHLLSVDDLPGAAKQLVSARLLGFEPEPLCRMVYNDLILPNESTFRTRLSANAAIVAPCAP